MTKSKKFAMKYAVALGLIAGSLGTMIAPQTSYAREICNTDDKTFQEFSSYGSITKCKKTKYTTCSNFCDDDPANPDFMYWCSGAGEDGGCI